MDSIAVSARDSSIVTAITLDGIPLTPKYLNILCAGLKFNEKLTNLSLTKCRVGDVGCDLLLGCLRNNPNLSVLNLSSCRLSNRSAMCISLFLKRRKADLLQNIWEQSSLQSREENSDKKPQGLQTLILNQNPKIGDVGVRQLAYALKSDVWLTSLSLRHCGITKRGAEIMIRLMQRNCVITKLDLTENRIPINTLQIVLRILKRRKETVENVTPKKRFRRDWRHKSGIRGPVKRDRKHFRSRTERLKKYSLQKRRWKKIRNLVKKMKQNKEALNPKEENCSRRKKLCDLESQLLFLIDSNLKLKEELSSNKTLLNAEAQQRSKMEDELQNVSDRLNDLRSKVVALNSVSSKACSDVHLLKGLEYIYEKLESFSTAKQDDTNDVDEDEVLNIVEPLWSSPVAYQRKNFTHCLPRRPYCPPLKI